MVEVLFAILIIVTLASAAVMSLRYPRFRAVYDMHKEAAVLAAGSAMEEALSLGYEGTNMTAGTYTLNDAAGSYSMNGMVLSGTRTVEDVTLSGVECRRITVSVDYTNSDGAVVFQTLITP